MGQDGDSELRGGGICCWVRVAVLCDTGTSEDGECVWQVGEGGETMLEQCVGEPHPATVMLSDGGLSGFDTVCMRRRGVGVEGE